MWVPGPSATTMIVAKAATAALAELLGAAKKRTAEDLAVGCQDGRGEYSLRV